MELTIRCVDAYKEQYPDDHCFIHITGGGVNIETKHKTYRQPYDETEEEFFDRLERSRKVGRNLFYEEWEIFEYEEGTVY